MTAYVYMVRCANGALYTGWTNDLAHRLAMHRSGPGPNTPGPSRRWTWLILRNCRTGKRLFAGNMP